MTWASLAKNAASSSDWIDQGREDIRTRDRIEQGAKEWLDESSPAALDGSKDKILHRSRKMAGNSEFLWSGSRLEGALSWAERQPHQLTANAEAFLEASQAHFAAELQDRRRRRRRSLQIAVGVATTTTILAAFAVFLFVRARNEARENRSQALTSQALVLLDSDPAGALRSAIEGYVVVDPPLPAAQDALVAARSAFRDANALAVHQVEHGAPTDAGAMSPDDQLWITGGSDGRVRFWELETGTDARPAIEVGAPISELAVAENANLLLVAAGPSGIVQRHPLGDGTSISNCAGGPFQPASQSAKRSPTRRRR